jgi:hypothetical protein
VAGNTITNNFAYNGCSDCYLYQAGFFGTLRESGAFKNEELPYKNPDSIKSETWSFKIFPNPTSAYVTVEFSGTPGNYDLTVYDMLNQQISHQHGQQPPDSKFELDLSDLADGIYLIKIAAKGESKAAKVVLVR